MLAGQRRAAMRHHRRPWQPGGQPGGSKNLGKAIGSQGGVASIFPKSIYFWIDGAAKKSKKNVNILVCAAKKRKSICHQHDVRQSGVEPGRKKLKQRQYFGLCGKKKENPPGATGHQSTTISEALSSANPSGLVPKEAGLVDV